MGYNTLNKQELARIIREGGMGGHTYDISTSGTNLTLTEDGAAKTTVTMPQGPKGDKGNTGDIGPQGPKGDTGAGVPTGGTTSQALVKKSNSNYDTEWADVAMLDDSTTTASNTWSANKISNELSDKSPKAGSSALTTCSKGTFDDAATKGVTTSASVDSTSLVPTASVTKYINDYLSRIVNMDLADNTDYRIEGWISGFFKTRLIVGMVASEGPWPTGYMLIQLSTLSGAQNFVWQCSSWSDRKVKENIEPCKINATQKLNELPCVSFNYKKEYNNIVGGHRDLGFIAQDIEDIIPEAVVDVKQPNGEVIKSIDYEKTIPYLIKAVQELSAEIEKLKGEK